MSDHITDEQLRVEVERRRLLVGVEANDPHDGYFAYDSPGCAVGHFNDDVLTWRSGVTWKRCAFCDEVATQNYFTSRVGWTSACPSHTPALSAEHNAIHYADGSSRTWKQ